MKFYKTTCIPIVGLVIAVTVMLIFSCQKENKISLEPIENLGGYKPQGIDTIDHWIKENLTDKFNISVKYQYDPFEIDYSKNTVPPKEQLIIPIMKIVIKCMIDPYLKNSDSTVLKKVVPKLWVLVGSPEYNNDGTIQLGAAEGSNKITIMEVNNYKKNLNYISNLCYTIIHEMAHILHQTKMYSPDFKFINPEDYTTAWFNIKESDAFAKGFVRNYAMFNADEDFVETISYLLVRGQEKFNKLVDDCPKDKKERLIKKQQLIIKYYKEKWDIDFKLLQKDVQQSIKDIVSTK